MPGAWNELVLAGVSGRPEQQVNDEHKLPLWRPSEQVVTCKSQNMLVV